METLEIKRLIREIGESVHSMNTIAVGLSKLNDNNCDIPNGLEISWKPNDIETSKIKSRNYAERAAMIYSVESFFDYLETISENPFWNHPEINFKEDNKKAIKVYNFLNQIPSIRDEVKILAEFACHWRNKIVHSSASKAKLSNDKIGRLRQLGDYINENYYHFDINVAFDNYDSKRITLKDSSTLITILIKAARQIDEFFFNEFSFESSIKRIKEKLKDSDCLEKIVKQQESDKRNRQIRTVVKMSFPFLNSNQIELTAKEL
ncbi:hypothetical protein [Galbibacter orientalis]|uniref:Uncharacterized protein n=1 Tax=Galbibacter orientalis DSM 19592 TaxID=926559 RepID=I3C6Q0_9FLAO|nr:hypothetical protein [Galbibacter orientalis]EIJ39293.1 hypothetical protein JoomaDRAFT_2305 [Galbibacter orientalis DSM 19592]